MPNDAIDTKAKSLPVVPEGGRTRAAEREALLGPQGHDASIL